MRSLVLVLTIVPHHHQHHHRVSDLRLFEVESGGVLRRSRRIREFLAGKFVKCSALIASNPANTTRWSNDVLMLDQRRRCWADIKTSLFQRVVFAGKIHLILVGRWWAIDNVGRSGQPYSGITNLYQTHKQTNKQTNKLTLSSWPSLWALT